MNKNERLDALKNAGIDVNAFIAMGIPAGTKVTIDTPDGKVEWFLEQMENMDAIKADPYYSRWTMAQVFDVLRSGKSIPEYLKHSVAKPYMYQFTQTLDRLREIQKLPVASERRKALEHFFTPAVAMSLARGYMDDLHKYVDGLKVRKHRGTPYKRIHGFGDVHCKDIEGVVFRELERAFDKMDRYQRNLGTFIPAFSYFIDNMVKFDTSELPLNKHFISAYQGRGAYLTLTGLVEFHGCKVWKRDESWRRVKQYPMSKETSLKAIHEKVDELQSWARKWFNHMPEWYMLWGMMKEVIKDNNFDFYKKMAEKYGK